MLIITFAKMLNTFLSLCPISFTWQLSSPSYTRALKYLCAYATPILNTRTKPVPPPFIYSTCNQCSTKPYKSNTNEQIIRTEYLLGRSIRGALEKKHHKKNFKWVLYITIKNLWKTLTNKTNHKSSSSL